MKLYVFTKKDIDRFLIECNFTPDEERLFRLRCKEHTLEYCAEEMNVSISTAKRLSRRVNNKIIKADTFQILIWVLDELSKALFLCKNSHRKS